MGCGSGTSQFPYLITPDSAIQEQVTSYSGRYESVLDSWNFEAIPTLVSLLKTTCIIFGNADSGEGSITIDGN